MTPHPQLALKSPSRVLKAESRMTDGGQEQIMAIDWCLEMDLSLEERGRNSIDSCSAGEAAQRLKVSASLLHFLKATGLPSQTPRGLKHVNFTQRLTEREWRDSDTLTLDQGRAPVLKELNQLATCQLYITQWWYGMSRTWTADRSALLPVLQQDILQVNAKLAELGKTAQQYTQNLFTPRQTFGVMIHAINYFIRMNGCQCC